MELKHPGHGAELDAREIRRLLDRELWETAPHDEDEEERSIYLGSVFSLTPSGKFYMPFACSNVAACDSCKGSGHVLNVKRRIHKKWIHAYERQRRLWQKRSRDWQMGQRHASAAPGARTAYRNYLRVSRTCTVCGGLGSREAHLDELWRGYAEALCESIGTALEWESGEAFVREYRMKENTDDGDE